MEKEAQHTDPCLALRMASTLTVLPQARPPPRLALTDPLSRQWTAESFDAGEGSLTSCRAAPDAGLPRATMPPGTSIRHRSCGDQKVFTLG